MSGGDLRGVELDLAYHGTGVVHAVSVRRRDLRGGLGPRGRHL